MERKHNAQNGGSTDPGSKIVQVGDGGWITDLFELQLDGRGVVRCYGVCDGLSYLEGRLLVDRCWQFHKHAVSIAVNNPRTRPRVSGVSALDQLDCSFESFTTLVHDAVPHLRQNTEDFIYLLHYHDLHQLENWQLGRPWLGTLFIQLLLLNLANLSRRGTII